MGRPAWPQTVMFCPLCRRTARGALTTRRRRPLSGQAAQSSAATRIPEIAGSTLYLIALGAVGLALLGALVEAVTSVSRKPQWASVHAGLRLVHSNDRRRRDLPFVGADRRSGGDGPADEAVRMAA